MSSPAPTFLPKLLWLLFPLALGCGDKEPSSDSGATDGDGDGFAAPEDCNDLDADTFPGAVEACDGVDNDCDGLLDDDDPDLSRGAASWYLDEDQDGHGGEDFISACLQPSGTVASSDDCDDADAQVSPDAREVCGDEVDNDCDGVSEVCITSLLQATTLTGEDQRYRAGARVGAAGDFNDDGAVDLLVGAPQNAEGVRRSNGALYLYFSVPNAESLDQAPLIVRGAGGNGVGHAFASLDVNDDGASDLLVGASLDDEGRGMVGVLQGPRSAGALDTFSTGIRMTGFNPGDAMGSTVAVAGDLNGDGNDDLAVGAVGSDQSGDDSGSVTLYHPPFNIVQGIVQPVGQLIGTGEGTRLGAQLAGVGDMDGDGLGELAVASLAAGDRAGAVYLVGGNPTATQQVQDLDTVLHGELANDLLGTALFAPGDVDGDGNNDLLVGAPGADVLYLVTALPETPTTAADMAWARVEGEGGQELGGAAHALQVDDRVAVAVGAELAGQQAGGAVWVFAELEPGVNTVDQALHGFEGLEPGDGLGASVALFALEGAVGLLVGAPQHSATGLDAGAVWVVDDLGL